MGPGPWLWSRLRRGYGRGYGRGYRGRGYYGRGYGLYGGRGCYFSYRWGRVVCY